MTSPAKPKRGDRGWPKYLPGGRMRTSTAALLIAFVALFWVYQHYGPPPAAEAPATQVVPPGFIPDPSYTWVPRTEVQRRTTTTTPTTTEETTTTSPGESTTPSESPTSPTSPTSPVTTTPTIGPPPPPSAPTPTPTPTPAPGQGPMSTPAAPTQ